MGAAKYENVGESQSVLIRIDPMISPHTRTVVSTEGLHLDRVVDAERLVALALAPQHTGS
jgi:hypothetical protein